ncbi:hypothetical protein DB31_3448 [Hyalangium minutum]|uniref:DoxX family protein n=1 Tax=Hyalangium minutum TaxID=394096 RepID=A0A085WUF5_9BACT|nr:hypothetical protein DB31_3448 [Hyalangium minutum]
MTVTENTTQRISDAALAHLGLRLVLGINIAVHGLVRVPAPVAFAEGMVKGFAETPLPAPLVLAFGVTLPFIELAVGVAVLLGLRLRWALFGGLLVMAGLTFGTCLQQNWNNAGLQLTYAVAYAALLATVAHARFTLDGTLERRTRS